MLSQTEKIVSKPGNPAGTGCAAVGCAGVNLSDATCSVSPDYLKPP